MAVPINLHMVVIALLYRWQLASTTSNPLSGEIRAIVTTPTNESLIASDTAISEAELVKFLFQNYSSDCRPRKNAANPVAISIGVSFYALNEIIERTHQMIATASLTVQWWDEFLTWEHIEPYNSVKLFAYPNTKIWLPDIALTNSGDLYALMNSRGMMAVVHSNGAVEYFPEATVTTFCQFDLTYFPFDMQICEYKFESWSYILQQQTFHLAQPPVNLHKYGANEQWELSETFAKTYNTCYIYTTTLSYCYPGAVYRLLLQRKSGYYTIMIIIPSIIFSLVELVAFSLPLAEVTKLQIIFTCLLSYAVFQTTVRTDMPRTSEHDPLMSIYFDLQMSYIAFALAGEAFVYLAQQQGFSGRKLPQWVLKLFRIKPEAYLNPRTSEAFLLKRQHPHSNGKADAKTEDDDENVNLEVFPIRNVLGIQSVKAEQADDHRSGSIPRSTIERRKWRALAARVETIVVCVYTVAIIITPLFMFSLAPVVFDSADRLRLEQFRS